MSLDDSAYCISPYGGVYYVNYVDGVMFSYGCTISPDTDWDDCACYVDPSGNVGYGFNVYGSYGIWPKYAFKFFQKYWWLRSPATFYDNGGVFLMASSGDLDYHYDGFGHLSYGRTIAGHSRHRLRLACLPGW